MKQLPSFIDPKTGQRYQDDYRIVPGTTKTAWQLTPDEYVSALVYPKDRLSVREYFDKTGWPEGYSYVPGQPDYARHTAWRSAVLCAVRKGLPVPPEVLEHYTGLAEYLAKYPL
jgi:hypothetical protein